MTAFRVNLRDGTTEAFDLETPQGRADWRALRRRSPEDITGLVLVSQGVSYAVPLPSRFEDVAFDVEPVAHRNGSGDVVADAIRVYVDDIAIQLLVYRGERNRGARLSVERAGRPVYIPSRDDE